MFMQYLAIAYDQTSVLIVYFLLYLQVKVEEKWSWVEVKVSEIYN